VNLSFSRASVTPPQIVNAALRYEGLPYCESSTYCKDGVGRTHCFGLFFLVCIDLGLLPPDFDVNLSPQTFGRPVENTLAAIITLNFRPVSADNLQMGDLMLLRPRGSTHEAAPRHVALCVRDQPKVMLHAAQQWMCGVGSVHTTLMDASHLGRLKHVWRMRNYGD